MHRIKAVSREILNEKLADSSIPAEDMHTKKDIMSLLVKARKAEEDTDLKAERRLVKNAPAPGISYRMTDEMMMDQVVGPPCSSFTAIC